MYEKRVYRPTARQLAWECLQQWARGKAFAESLIDQAAKKHALSHSDRALMQAIVYGTLRHKDWMVHICGRLRSAPLEEALGWLIAGALYQIFIMEQPEYAVVNETVSIAPARGRGLVNGMLRSALRQKEEILAERETLPLHVRYSTPEWIVKRWVAELGEESTAAMLQWNETTPPLYARINPIKPPAELPEAWEAVEGLELWYRIQGALPKDLLAAGQLYIADPSTRHCVRLLAPQEGERVLDACAAPGGKSVAMIGATMGNLNLLCTDSQKHRLEPLKENLQVAGGKQIDVCAHDWTKPCPDEWKEAFDAVLIDVPCSNTGVFQRRVDARWRLTLGELDRISKLQLLIATRAAEAVKPGGRLVYSTCSIDRAENQDNVAKFLQKYPQFSLQGEYLALPHAEKADGAYAALLVRHQ